MADLASTAPTPIDLGGIGVPSQKTVTTPGAYAVAVSVLADNPEITFQGPGAFTVDSVATVLGTTTFAAVDGAQLTINGLAGLGSTTDLLVDGTSSITIGTGVSADNPINAQFSGAGGTLTFAPGLLMLLTTAPTVLNFGAGDHIDFGAPVAPTDLIDYIPNASDTGGTLTLETAGGAVVGSVNLTGSYTIKDFKLGADGIDFACFLRGTHIATASGEVAVETLRAGDLVVTAAHGLVPVVAVRMRVFGGTEVASDRVRPVRIAAGALGDDLPHCDLYVSPDHSMYLDGHLVPAHLLVNGRTITQPARSAAVEYFHVEIEPHGIIIAEGAACESYLDIGNHSHFDRPGIVALFPATEPKNWEDACAPLLLQGPRLVAIRNRLLAHADELAEQAQAFQKVA